jgi:perosamine synthetase
MWKIPLFKIFWDEADIEAVNSVIKRGMDWCNGEEISKFEEMVAEYVGRKFGAAFNSGTSALHATLLAFKVKPRDEVIVPSFTFIATANSPLFVGAKPVFADIEEVTYGLDPQSVEARITKATKALIPIHYGGLPCQIDNLREVAQRYNIFLIEDVAEALGARKDNNKVGSFGDAAIFSFCQNKITTSGEGGMVLTDSREIYERLKQIRSHGRYELEPYFATEKSSDYVVLGYNWRLSSIAAALGVSQMKKIEKLIEMRIRNAEYMTSKLSRVKDIKPPNPPEGHFHVYQMYTIRIGRTIRDKLRTFLANKGVMTKVYFDPVHLTSFYKKKFKYTDGVLPVTEKISKSILTLPMYPNLSREEMDYIANSISDFFNYK